MAFALDIDQKATVEVIVSKDMALDMTDEEYAEYTSDVTTSDKLKFRDGFSLDDCTKFVLKKNLSYKQTQKVLEEQISSDIKGNTTIKVGWMLTELRYALVDIKNPKTADTPIPFKRGSDGNAHEDIVAGIYSAGVIADLNQARRNLSERKPADVTKKKL